jgi:hypothetical protein
LGIFETSTLSPYLEISIKLHDYVEAYNQATKEDLNKEHLKLIKIIREELEISLNRLSSPSNRIL